ncbi:MAG TPA: helix-turn-helix transcriptional regulator [Thermoanaerobaculia bacterium]|jgi:DNA-binding XRE family transcriptional regulator
MSDQIVSLNASNLGSSANPLKARIDRRNYLVAAFKSRPLIFQEIRANLGMTQSTVAIQIGVHLNSVCGWETGKAIPTIKNAERYYETLEKAATEQGNEPDAVWCLLRQLVSAPGEE